MEYQKIMNLLDNTNTQPSKFIRESWIEINDQSQGTYNTEKIKLKATNVKAKSLWL